MNLCDASTFSITDLMRAPNEVNSEIAPLDKAKGKAKATTVEPEVLCSIHRTGTEETRYFRLRVLRTIVTQKLGMHRSALISNNPLLIFNSEDIIGAETRYSWVKFLDCAIEHKLCLVNWRMNTFVPGLPVFGKAWKWSVLPVGPVKDMVNSIENGGQGPRFEPWTAGKVKCCLLFKPYTDCFDRPEKIKYVRPSIP